MPGTVRSGKTSPRDKVVALRTLRQMGLPPPPKEENLSPAAAREWCEIVATYPADRFPRATWTMLAGYCQHTIERRRIAADIEELVKEPDYSRREYREQLKSFNEQTKVIASLGVRLGIARTSMAGRHNHDPDNVAEHNLPWEA